MTRTWPRRRSGSCGCAMAGSSIPSPRSVRAPSSGRGDHGPRRPDPRREPGAQLDPPGRPRAARAGGHGGRRGPRAARTRPGGDRRVPLRPGHRPGRRPPGRGVIDAFGFALAIAWATAGLVVARSADRTAAPLIGLGALAGTVGLTAARIGASEGDAHGPARVLATLAGCGVIAVSFHYLLALPGGRLGRPGRRIMAALGYASAAGIGVGLAVAGHPFTVTAGAVIWPLAVACALPATRLR